MGAALAASGFSECPALHRWSETVARLGRQHHTHLRLIDSCITQLKAQGPSRTCNESKEEEEKTTYPDGVGAAFAASDGSTTLALVSINGTFYIYIYMYIYVHTHSKLSTLNIRLGLQQHTLMAWEQPSKQVARVSGSE